MINSFLYCWTDKSNNKLYVGKHKGSEDDGYVCSSKTMLKEYKQRPNDFSRSIIAHGTEEDIAALEYAVLKSSNAHISEEYYNLALPNGVCMSTPAIRKAQSVSAKRRGYNRDANWRQSSNAKKTIGLNNPRRRPISTPLGSFSSAEEASKEVGLSAITIRKLCRGVKVTFKTIERNNYFTKKDLGVNTNALGWCYD